VIIYDLIVKNSAYLWKMNKGKSITMHNSQIGEGKRKILKKKIWVWV